MTECIAYNEYAKLKYSFTLSYSIVIIAMQIEYSSNFVKALISMANVSRDGSLNAKFAFKRTSSQAFSHG